MHLLNTITITVAGLMVGNELAISAFVNPALWRLEPASQAQGIASLARALGRVMPLWYGLCLALLAFESFLHRRDTAFVPLVAATLLWASIIVFSIVMLVPINNRISLLDAAALVPGWRRDHERWDALHRVRIVLLAGDFFLLAYALAA